MRDEVSGICTADSQVKAETDVPCTCIIITAGAWSRQVFPTLLPNSSLELPVSRLAVHSPGSAIAPLDQGARGPGMPCSLPGRATGLLPRELLSRGRTDLPGRRGLGRGAVA